MFRLMRLQERNFTIWRGNVKSYLKMDFYRMLTSKYFGIGILGVVGVYGFSLVQLKSQDVYLLNYYIKFYSTYMLLLIFGAVAYSNAMMEDLEYKNYYLQIQKGSFRKLSESAYYARNNILVSDSGCGNDRANGWHFFCIRYVVVFICKKSNVYSYGSYSRVLLFCQLFYKNIWRE